MKSSQCACSLTLVMGFPCSSPVCVCEHAGVWVSERACACPMLNVSRLFPPCTSKPLVVKHAPLHCFWEFEIDLSKSSQRSVVQTCNLPSSQSGRSSKTMLLAPNALPLPARLSWLSSAEVHAKVLSSLCVQMRVHVRERGMQSVYIKGTHKCFSISKRYAYITG